MTELPRLASYRKLVAVTLIYLCFLLLLDAQCQQAEYNPGSEEVTIGVGTRAVRL